jgi:integrase
MAAAQFADAKTRLGTVPLSAAVDFYLQRHPKEPAPRTVQAVVDELVDTKEIDGVSHVYLKHLRYHLGKFAARFKGNIGDVSGAEIDVWLRAAGLSLRTRNNMRTVLSTLFNFAKVRRYLPKDHSELDAVPIVKQPVGKIEVFTPAEMVEALCFTEDRMIPFMVLGAFAGIRHSEILRLEWKELRLDDGFVEVTAAKAKTAGRRLVPIVDNLREWLLKYRRDEGPVCELLSAAPEIHDIVLRINQARLEAWQKKQLERQALPGGLSALADGLGPETAGAEEDFQPFRWRQNVLRHSFISYRVAMVQNVDQVALEAGNSRQMVFSNYRELVTPKAAQEWFTITPKVVEEARGAKEKAEMLKAES